MQQLAQIISERIQRNGPISFCDFMETALYHPGLGYYDSPGEKIGIAGDYYTSPVLTPLFGEMIARQMKEMWALLGKKKFTIVEFGAGTGALCECILHSLARNPELYDELSYFIIERSCAMRELEKKRLPEKATWIDDISEADLSSACIFSNEMLDNFPVHLVVMQDELKEVFVNYHDGFTEVLLPAGEDLQEYFASLQIRLPKGFRTEANLQAIHWLKAVASALEKGFLLTIDYGYPSGELYRNCRSAGTLLCYSRHTVNDNPYDDIGGQDITSHVNFSALNRWGADGGLELCGYTDQARFMLSLGLANHLREMEQQPRSTVRVDRLPLLQTFLMDMGKRFKVLIQKKGIAENYLSGMQFSQGIQ